MEEEDKQLESSHGTIDISADVSVVIKDYGAEVRREDEDEMIKLTHSELEILGDLDTHLTPTES